MSQYLLFDGETYIPKRDGTRLGRALGETLSIMQDGEWHTINEIASRVRCSSPAASARIRDLRKEKFGGYNVERRHVSKGLWEYRIA
jgi:hypothetical protein